MWGMAQPKGFVAYISAVILAAILLTLSTALSFSLWYTQSDLLAYEYAQRSLLAARECTDAVVVALIQNSAFVGGVPMSTTEGLCEVGVVTSTAMQYAFFVTAMYNTAHTQAEVVVDATSFTIQSWRAVP